MAGREVGVIGLELRCLTLGQHNMLWCQMVVGVVNLLKFAHLLVAFLVVATDNSSFKLLFRILIFYCSDFRHREEGGERDRDRHTGLLFYVLMRSLVDCRMYPDGDEARSLGKSGRCSNQLSYPGKAIGSL